jgi:glycosyltransferase involved in cell wall biosynthesis
MPGLDTPCLNPMKLVCWQSILTEHQVHLMKALHTELSGQLQIVCGTQELTDRKQQGWVSPDTEALVLIDLPTDGWWHFARKLIDQNIGAIHLFGGLWADRRFLPIMLYAQWKNVATALLSESYSETNVSYFADGHRLSNLIKQMARPWLYRSAGLLLGRKILAVFAISDRASQQFTRAGFPSARLFPFAYFVPATSPLTESQAKKTALHLIFVGSLVERKGLPTLIEAIHLAQPQFEQRGIALKLDIFGPGIAPTSSELPHGVTFKGRIPFGQAQTFISAYDTLVLPSRHDGWGVVVNEALLQGVPAIVSDGVGAQALVKRSGAGTTFPTGSASALAQRLQQLLEHPELLQQWKNAAQAFKPCLNPTVGAHYLIDCLKYARGNASFPPEVPWYPDK